MATQTLTGEQLASVTREMVRITSRHYGRGATEGKAYQCDNFVFCVLKDGLTVTERGLIEHGDERLVREVRAQVHVNHGTAFAEAVERIAGRPVLTHSSQLLLDPDYTVEIFVLGDGQPLTDSPISADG